MSVHSKVILHKLKPRQLMSSVPLELRHVNLPKQSGSVKSLESSDVIPVQPVR